MDSTSRKVQVKNDEPRELFPIRIMNFGGLSSTSRPDQAVADFRPSVLPADAEDPRPARTEESESNPKDSSATEPASDSSEGSSGKETSNEQTPSPSVPPEDDAPVVKVTLNPNSPLLSPGLAIGSA